jgi:hypothetical protein
MSRLLINKSWVDVEQLKMHSYYDNFSFDKNHYGKLNKVAVLNSFPSVPIEMFL